MGISKVILNATIAFFFLFIIAKIMGKKQIAQLDFIDYIIAISLGSIAGEMAFETEIPFYYFLIGMAVFAALDIILSLVGRKFNFLKKIVIGSPVILIDKGKLLYQNIKKTKLSINEFLSLCREQGYFDITNIAYCILETSGKISILPIGEAMPVVAKDLNINLPPSSLSTDVILDGKIIEATLGQLNKDRKWVLERLKIKDEDAVKDIALAIYDEKKDEFYVHPKVLSD